MFNQRITAINANISKRSFSFPINSQFLQLSQTSQIELKSLLVLLLFSFSLLSKNLKFSDSVLLCSSSLGVPKQLCSLHHWLPLYPARQTSLHLQHSRDGQICFKDTVLNKGLSIICPYTTLILASIYAVFLLFCMLNILLYCYV